MLNFAFFVIRDTSSTVLLHSRTKFEQNCFAIAIKAEKLFQQWTICFCALNEILISFEKMIDDMITLITDILRKMNIENMIMKSHSYNNFLMIALFMKMNTLINTIVKLANTCYTSSTMICIICMTSLMI